MLKKLSFLCVLLMVFSPSVNAQAVAGDLIIDLDPADLANGPVETWDNEGTGGGALETAQATPVKSTWENLAGESIGQVTSTENDPRTTFYWNVQPLPEGLTDGDFSIEAWVNTNVHDAAAAGSIFNGTWTTVLGMGNAQQNQYIELTGRNNQWGVRSSEGNWYPVDALPGTWTHLAVTYDGTTIRHYVNGVEVTAQERPNLTIADGDTAGGSRFRMSGLVWSMNGGPDPWNLFNGNYGRIRVHDGTLLADEVLANYDAEKEDYSQPNLLLVQPMGDVPEIDFGGIGVGEIRDAEVTLKNLGDTVIELTIGLEGDMAFYFSETPPESIAAGAEETFLVQFEPGESGPKTGTLNITGDCTECSISILLSGDTIIKDPVVDLDAGTLALGPVTADTNPWENTAADGGLFNQIDGDSVVREFTNASGEQIQYVYLDDSRIISEDPAPSLITGGNPYTLEVWVADPENRSESCVFQWANRGGPNRATAQFGVAANRYGAVHWGFDPWVNESLEPGWHYIVWTYDPNAGEPQYILYKDTEVKLTRNETNLNFKEGNPMGVGGVDAQTFKGKVGRIRVSPYAMSETEIDDQYFAEIDTFTLPDLTLVSASSVDFGTVNFGAAPFSETVTLRNGGDDTFNLTTIEIIGTDADDFQFPDGSTQPELIEPGATVSFDVEFNPATLGPKEASLHIVGDCNFCELDIPMTGNGQNGALGFVYPVPDQGVVALGTAEVGETGPVTSIIIENVNPGFLNFTSVSLSGDNPGEFTVVDPDLTVLNPGEQRMFEVALQPTVDTSLVTATLNIETVEDGTHSVLLLGNEQRLYVGTVNAEDNADTHGTDSSTPFATINFAIAQAGVGTVIEVADGEYAPFDLADEELNLVLKAANPGMVSIEMEDANINMTNETGASVVSIEGFNMIKSDSFPDAGIFSLSGVGNKWLTLQDCHVEGNGEFSGGGRSLIRVDTPGDAQYGVNVINSSMRLMPPEPTHQKQDALFFRGGGATRFYMDNSAVIDVYGDAININNTGVMVILNDCYFENVVRNAIYHSNARGFRITGTTFVFCGALEGYYWGRCDDGWVIDRCLFERSNGDGRDVNDDQPGKQPRHDSDVILNQNDYTGARTYSNSIFIGGREGMRSGSGWPAHGFTENPSHPGQPVVGPIRHVNCTWVGVEMDYPPEGEGFYARKEPSAIRLGGAPQEHTWVINCIVMGYWKDNFDPDGNWTGRSPIRNIIGGGTIENTIFRDNTSQLIGGDPLLAIQGGTEIPVTLPDEELTPEERVYPILPDQVPEFPVTFEELPQLPNQKDAVVADLSPTEASEDVISMGQPAGLEVDFAGNPWGDPPSIGALEFADVTGVAVFIGDANCDGQINIVDVISILGHLFSQQAACCAPNMDINGDDQLNIVDGVNLLGFQFSQGTMTAPDGTILGADDTGCIMYEQADIPDVGGCDNPCTP